MRRTPSVRLVAFDLDGTITRGPTVCEAIAEALGCGTRMRELEQLTELDAIQLAREEMADWYRGAAPQVIAAYQTGTCLAPGAREAFQWLRTAGTATAILSVTWEFAVRWFADQLHADHYVGTRLTEEGRVEHVWPRDKADHLTRLMRQYGLPPSAVAAVGDSWGDLPMLRAVGRPVFVGTGLPPDIAGLVHAPGADLLTVAQRLVPPHP